MNKLLVDTSVIIDFLRSKQKGKSFFANLAARDDQLYISIITHAELFSGKSIWQNKRARSELELLLSGLEIVTLNKNVSQQAGRFRALYNIGLLDAMIAATAVTSNLPLATLNLKHFEPIKDLKLWQKM